MAEPQTELRIEGASHWQEGWKRLRKNKLALAGLYLIIIMDIACLVGPLLSPYQYDTGDLKMGAVSPSSSHWLGTDIHGRDQLTRILHGGRISLAVGVVATIVSLLIGVSYGMLSGWLGGWTDRVMMRALEITYALPFTIFVILLVVLFERHLWLIFLAIGAVEWLAMARIVRGQVLTLKTQQYVEASRALGRPDRGILVAHILPNLTGIIIIYATLTVPNVMLLEAFISFLGLGVQAPMTSWGDLIRSGAEAMEAHPWLLVGPSVFFATTLFALNFLGDGLRDAFDPKSNNMS